MVAPVLDRDTYTTASQTADAVPARRAEDRRFIAAVSVIALAAYAVLGLYLALVAQWGVFDAIHRSATARLVLFGHDPHLASIPQAWMPLPILSQLPFTILSELIGVRGISGPLTNACYMAGTVFVLGRLFVEAGLRPFVRRTLLVIYAINPVTVLYAVNGMAEASATFFTALAFLYLLRWVRTDRWRNIGMLGLSLGFATLCRVELLPAALVVAAIVAIREARSRRWPTFVTVATPAVFVVLGWCAYSWVIRNDPLAWAKLLKAAGEEPASGIPGISAHRDLWNVGLYSLKRVALLAPMSALLLVWAIGHLRKSTRRTSGAVAFAGLGLAAIFPGQVSYLLLSHSTWAVLRFYMSVVMPVFVTSAVLLGSTTRPAARRTAECVVLLGALAGIGTTVVALRSPVFGYYEGEQFLTKLVTGEVGSPHDRMTTSNNGGVPDTDMAYWRSLADALDREMQPNDLAVVDTSLGFPLVLYMDRVNQLLVPEDRQFDAELSAADRGSFNWIILSTEAVSEGREPHRDLLKAALENPPVGKRWVRDESIVNRRAFVYRLVSE